MPFRSQFSERRRPVLPPSRGSMEKVVLNFKGLDLTSPYDMNEEGRSPNAANFRLYAEEENDRRVAVSSRNGSGRYLDAVSEAISDSDEDLTGVADNLLGYDTNWHATPFTPATAGPLSKVALSVKADASAVGPIVVEVYDDNDGVPGDMIASSGIPNSELSTAYDMVFARFVEAPSLLTSDTYWIVAHLQDDNIGNFYWRSNTASTPSLTSSNGGNTWSATTQSLLFRAYSSSAETIKGMARYAPSSSANRTIVAIGDKLYQGTDGTNSLAQIVTGLASAAEEYSFAFGDNKLFWVNGTDELTTWDGTTTEEITHTQLPILRLISFHKNVLWGITADDPNKLVYSVGPIEEDALGNVWYKGWRSTNFGYVPAPKASDPITAILPFQDMMTVATATTKFTISGSNPADINPRQATGKKGIVSQKGAYADENYLYFVAPDGFYRYNGSEDTIISDRIQTEFDSIADLSKVVVTKWKRQIRFYYPSSGSSYNNKCLIWHTVHEEWMMDTDTYVSHAVAWTDGDDEYMLTEASSTSTAVHFAETEENNLGKDIDFYYDCKYDSMGNPAKKKRINKLYPLLEGSGEAYNVQVGLDKDRNNSPEYEDYPLETVGPKIGNFLLDGSVNLGTTSNYKPKRFKAPGYGYYWQLRIKRKAIDNPVKFIGYSLSYREKKL